MLHMAAHRVHRQDGAASLVWKEVLAQHAPTEVRAADHVPVARHDDFYVPRKHSRRGRAIPPAPLRVVADHKAVVEGGVDLRRAAAKRSQA